MREPALRAQPGVRHRPLRHRHVPVPAELRAGHEARVRLGRPHLPQRLRPQPAVVSHEQGSHARVQGGVR